MYKTTIEAGNKSVYDIHRDVMALFEGKLPARVLWRRDGDVITVVSNIPIGEQCEELNYKLKEGVRYWFSWRFNPTVKRDGKRWLTRSLNQWLERKASENGFEVVTVSRLRDEGVVECKNGVKLPSFDMRGELRITDMAAFTRALERGIGSQKAWGFGLLSLDVLHKKDSA